MLLLATQQKT